MSRRIYAKTKEEIELIRENCLIVSDALALIAEILKPGITAKELDEAAEELILDRGARPAFKGYEGFPATLCISPNDVVVHGIPNNYEFVEGDIVSIDCGTHSKGYFGDAAYTFAIGEIPEETVQLLKITRESLYKGIDKAIVGNRIGDIGAAVQKLTERKYNYGVVRELVGHGVGRELHEEPQVPNYGRRGKGKKLQDGWVIAIEPMINLGKRHVFQEDDGWTIRTRDRSVSAHFEHTVAVGVSEADILSDHVRIEENIKKNPNLLDF